MWALTTKVAGLALGVAASPLPVVAVMVVLLTRRARLSSVILLASWMLGNVIAITLAILFADSIRAPRAGLDLPSEGIFTLLLGIGLVILVAIERRGRFRSSDPSAPPRWVKSVDDMSPAGGAFIAFSNATTSPKNLALALSAGLAIRQANLVTPRDETWLTLVYVGVSSISVLVPVVVFFVGGEKSQTILRRWKDAITSHATAIAEIIVFMVGIGLSIKGIINLIT